MDVPSTQQWPRGTQARLAREAGISRQHLCDILAGRKTARPGTALRLEEACLALDLPWRRLDFLYPLSEGSLSRLRAGG